MTYKNRNKQITGHDKFTRKDESRKCSHDLQCNVSDLKIIIPLSISSYSKYERTIKVFFPYILYV